MNRVWCLLRKAIPILVITTMLSSIITVAPVFAAATPTVTSIPLTPALPRVTPVLPLTAPI